MEPPFDGYLNAILRPRPLSSVFHNATQEELFQLGALLRNFHLNYADKRRWPNQDHLQSWMG